MTGRAAGTGPTASVRDDAGRHADDVIVVLRERAAAPAGDRALLVDVVAEATGVDPTEVEVSRNCARCGGDHGRPVVVRCGDRAVHGIEVSLSRAGGSVAIAVSFAGPVGIDIESIDTASRAAFDDVAFGPADRERLGASGGSPALRTAMWTAKEAVLKATGEGLRVDPRDLEVSAGEPAHPGGPHPSPALVAWPGAPCPVDSFHLTAIDAGPGLLGTVAVIAGVRPVVRRVG